MRISVIFLAILIAPIAMNAQPPALPSGARSADTPKSDPESNSLDSAEDAMVKRDWTRALSILGEHLSSASLTGEDRARSEYDMGFAEEASERPTDAIEAYRRAIAANPKQFEAHAAVGHLLINQGKTAEGRDELVIASGLAPATGDANTAKAEIYRALARLAQPYSPQQASSYLLEALKLTQETPADTLLSGEIAENGGDLVGAEAAYRRALVNDRDSIAAAASLAHLLIREKRYADAVPLAEHVHAAVPKDAEVTQLLANLYLATGDAAKADALDAALIASGAGSKNAFLYVSRGEALLRQHDFGGAQAAYQRAADLDSSLAEAWSGLAFAASENHQYPVALKALTMQSKLQPDSPAALFLWATTYDNLRQYKAAVVYYKKFLAAAKGNFPDQEFEARHRLLALERMH